MEGVKLHTSPSEEEQLELASTLSANDFLNTNVMIATPCFGGQVSESYMRGLLGVTQILQYKNIPYFVFTIANESLITRARNAVEPIFSGKKTLHKFYLYEFTT